MRLESILPGILATRPEHPFGDEHAARAFLIERPAGPNMLLYASSHIADYVDHLAEVGMPSHQLLTHRDEASKFCNVLPAKVFCHADERTAIEAKGARVDETFDGAECRFGDDLIAYHAPGHTPGVAIYHWKRPEGDGGSVLFTGDTLYGSADGGLEYAPFFIHPYAEKQRDYARTLALIRRLRPASVVPGLSAAGTFVFPYDDELLAEMQQRIEMEQ